MIRQPFDRAKHVYHNEAFVELVKDAVRFFNGTPIHDLPPLKGLLELEYMRSTTQGKTLCNQAQLPELKTILKL